jgi:hypothetical protein
MISEDKELFRNFKNSRKKMILEEISSKKRKSNSQEYNDKSLKYCIFKSNIENSNLKQNPPIKQDKTSHQNSINKNKEELLCSRMSSNDKYILEFHPSKIIEMNSDYSKNLKNQNEKDSKCKKPTPNSSIKNRNSSKKELIKKNSQINITNRGKSMSLRYSKSGISDKTTSGYQYFGRSGRNKFQTKYQR